MNDFHEAVLTFDVPAGMGQVYKKQLKMITVGIGLKTK